MREFTTPLITQLKKQLKEAETPYKNVAKDIFDDQYNMELSYESGEILEINQGNIYDLITDRLLIVYSKEELIKIDKYMANIKSLNEDEELELDEFLHVLSDEIGEIKYMKIDWHNINILVKNESQWSIALLYIHEKNKSAFWGATNLKVDLLDTSVGTSWSNFKENTVITIKNDVVTYGQVENLNFNSIDAESFTY
ncbi:hypothetical protein [Liquorilactobacillus hordei]|uniref:hypothetical protein n=1 Tax=Liquorilactobacillus hordei TaxID=468911 RepID=UPI0039EB1789